MRSKFIIILLILIISCDDDNSTNSDNSNGDTATTWIESEPSPTADHNYIYYINDDTVSSDKSGIYRARTDQPIREEILHGEGYHSPTIAVNNDTLAFLDSNGIINFYDISEKSLSVSGISDDFNSITFINDSIIIGNREDSLFLVNKRNNTSSFFSLGWDPTLYAIDTFICITQGGTGYYQITRFDDFDTSPNILRGFNISPPSLPRWASAESLLNHFVFVIEDYDKKEVYTGTLDTNDLFLIDSTGFNKPCLINYDFIIYSGPDGRLFQSNFAGTNKFPYWEVIDPE